MPGCAPALQKRGWATVSDEREISQGILCEIGGWRGVYPTAVLRSVKT